MKNKFTAGILLLVMMISTSACGIVDNPSQEVHQTDYSEADVSVSTADVTAQTQPSTEISGDIMKMTVDGKEFEIVLENNETAAALKEMMPLTIDMSELNGNEKYKYLDTKLPSAPQKVGNISNGDIMLYGDNCLVVFYDSFSTPYSYTKIGHISNVSELAETLGKGGITAFFRLNDEEYTVDDLHCLSDFLHGNSSSEELAGKKYDLNGDNCWDVLDLCLMRKKINMH